MLFLSSKRNAKQPLLDAKMILQLSNNPIFGDTILKNIEIQRGLKSLASK